MVAVKIVCRGNGGQQPGPVDVIAGDGIAPVCLGQQVAVCIIDIPGLDTTSHSPEPVACPVIGKGGVGADPGQAVGLVKAVVCGSPFLFGTELALVVVIVQGRVRGHEPVTGIGGGFVAGRQGSGCRNIFVNGPSKLNNRDHFSYFFKMLIWIKKINQFFYKESC